MIYTYTFLLFFYCRIFSDINTLFLSLIAETYRVLYSYIKIKGIPIKYTPLFIVPMFSF